MNKLSYAIVFVSDMSRSVRFYRDVLGIPLKFESPGWSELANEGSTIALHQAGSGAAAEGRNRAGSCQLGFQVADIDALHRDLTEKQVTCVQPPTPQPHGIRQAIYLDPDGLAFTVASPMR